MGICSSTKSRTDEQDDLDDGGLDWSEMNRMFAEADKLAEKLFAEIFPDLPKPPPLPSIHA
jgi:hypothetical protein